MAAPAVTSHQSVNNGGALTSTSSHLAHAGAATVAHSGHSQVVPAHHAVHAIAHPVAHAVAHPVAHHAVHAPVVSHAAPVVAHHAVAHHAVHAAPLVSHAVHHAAPVVHAAPAYHAPVAVVHKKELPEPYTYTYGVADDYSKANFNAAETSDANGVVSGSYSVSLPDGRIQHVKYTADHVNGYVAEVTYEGTPVYPEAKPYVAPKPAYHA